MAREGQLARDVRAGLEVNMQLIDGGSKQAASSPLDVVSHGKTARKHVWEFACIFAFIGLMVASWMMYKDLSLPTAAGFIVASLILLMLGAFAPIVLLPVWRSWMLFAHYLGIVMSTIIVSIAWSVMLVPIAILLKVIGKSVMDLSFDRSRESYWEEREEKLHNFQLLERQF